MRRHRFTIAGILAFVVLPAVGLAALREATDAWDSAMFGATLCALACAVLMAVQRRERRRAFWLGFALFGSVYLGASLVPSIGARLPTTRSLAVLASSAVGQTSGLPLRDWLLVSSDGAKSTSSQPVVADLSRSGTSDWRYTWMFTGAALSDTGTAENFVRIGHSLAALVIGLLGGLLSRRLHDANRTNDVTETCGRGSDGP